MANPQTEEYESDLEDAPLHSLRRREASDDESTDGRIPVRRDPRGQTWYDDDSDEQCGAPGSDDDREFGLEEGEVVKVIIEEEKMKNDRGEKQFVSVSGSLEGQSLGRETTDQAAEQHGDSRYRVNQRRGWQGNITDGRILWEDNEDLRFQKMNLNVVPSSKGGQVPTGRFQGYGSHTGRGYVGDNGSPGYHNLSTNYNQSNYGRNNDRSKYYKNTGRKHVGGSQSNHNQNNYGSTSYNWSNYADDNNYVRRNARDNYQAKDDRKNYGKSNGSNNYDPRNYARRKYSRNTGGEINGQNNYVQGNYVPNNERRNYDRNNFNNRSNFPRSVRGKGSMRYVPAQNKSNELAANQRNQSTLPKRPNPEISVGSQPKVSNLHPDPVLPRKNVLSSNLNPAAKPYYPTGSSLIDLSFPSTQCGTSMDRIINSNNVTARNSINNPLLQSSESSSTLQSGIRSSYLGIPDTNKNTLADYRRPASLNQIASVPMQIQPPIQPASASFSQQQGQQPGSEYHNLDLYQDPTSVSVEHEERRTDSVISSSKSMILMAEKEKTGNPDSENATILHNGAQTECPLYSSKSKTSIDQKGDTGEPEFETDTFMYNGAKIFTAACAMDHQDGDQGSLGVHVVHRVLPEYVAQSQHAFGNSWLRMLAGATGDFGASHCYPEVALDSGSSLDQASSMETSSTIPSSTCQPPQATETVIGEIPRPRRRLRYSEMDFSKP